MKGSRFLLSFWLSTAAFCLLQIVFGPGGFTEMARLKEQQARLDVRLESLRADNQRLTAQYEALRTSTEAIRLEARSLGWFQSGDIPVRTLDGAEFRLPSDSPDLSLVPRMGPGDADLSLFFRLAWPILFGTFYAFLYLMSKMWPPSDRWDDLVEAGRRNLPIPLQTGLDFFRK